MTTPAIHIDLLESKPNNYKRIRKSDGAVIFDEDMDYGPAIKTFETRPESGNATRIGGFLCCRGWLHEGRRYTFQGGQMVRDTPTDIITSTGSIWRANGHLTFGDPVYPSNNMMNACLSKALDKLKSQDVHLGAFIAEGRQLSNMLARTAVRIAREVRSFRRRNPKEVWELIKHLEGRVKRHRWCEIPSNWLELQYGWNPLLSDLYGGMNHLARRQRFQLPFVSVRSTMRDQVEILSGCTSRAFAVTGEVKFLCERRVTTNLVYGLKSPPLAELSSLGLINPAEIVWELLPYSFVVDWLVPVGQWLSGLTAATGYSFITGGQSLTGESGVISSRIVSMGSATSAPPPGLSYFRSKKFKRICYGASPVPGLYVKNPFSLTHVANAMSLLVQAFR